MSHKKAPCQQRCPDYYQDRRNDVHWKQFDVTNKKLRGGSVKTYT